MRRVGFIVAVLALAWSLPAWADSPLVSPNYQIQQSFIGGGGLTVENSPSYEAGESIGDTATGNSSSANYQTNSGYTTTSDPALTFVVNTTSTSIGTLSYAAANFTYAAFSAIDYTSYGYNVIVVGSTPSNGSHNLTAMSGGNYTLGTEGFGMNLVKNGSLGLNPSGGFGVAATGYKTANSYKYNSGDTIATSPKSSGQTNFTITYVATASVNTPGGNYTGNQTLICVASY